MKSFFAKNSKQTRRLKRRKPVQKEREREGPFGRAANSRVRLLDKKFKSLESVTHFWEIKNKFQIVKPNKMRTARKTRKAREALVRSSASLPKLGLASNRPYSDMYQCRLEAAKRAVAWISVFESVWCSHKVLLTEFDEQPTSPDSSLLMNWKNTSNSTKVFLKLALQAERLQLKGRIKNGCNQRTMLPSRPVPNEAAANYEFSKP